MEQGEGVLFNLDVHHSETIIRAVITCTEMLYKSLLSLSFFESTSLTITNKPSLVITNKPEYF